MHTLPLPLAPLAARPQFVCWFAAPIDNKPGKFNKFPCNAAGDVIDAHDATNWLPFDAASAIAASRRGWGVGYVFTSQDPYAFLDIDSCLLPDNTWSPLALELVAALGGAACEVSHSGHGLHVIGRYRGDEPEHAKRNTPLGLELYTSKRFIALTGISAQGTVDQDITEALYQVIGQYFPPSTTGDFPGWTNAPVPEWRGATDDEELITKATASAQRNAAAVFGGGGKATFADLWTGNVDALARAWPSSSGKVYDGSSADQSLANHLAFWTGKDCERIERLMRRSALARDKWDTHRSYLGATILQACRVVTNVATGPRNDPPPVLVPPAPPEVLAAVSSASGRAIRVAGREYMSPVEQMEHFAGCYFVSDLGKIWSMPLNTLLAKTSFDVRYGGHLFVINQDGSKVTDSAWDAYTKSRVLAPVVVDDMCFRPELAPGAVVIEGNYARVNAYVPYDCPVSDGDVAPFLDLLARQLPVENDRKILLSYMASFAQNPGRKFQWWPVLQGVKGNGKTLIVRAMKYIAGDRYSHLPNAAAMVRDGLKFNSWIERKLFIGVEEIKATTNRDFLDEFKVVVTNESMPFEGKGANQVTGDNRANGIICTNPKDGIPITDDERRYAIFFMAQQSVKDLAAYGMDGDYFPRLYDWFKSGGDAIIAGYLKRYVIDAAYDPADLSHRAPMTSSTAEAIQASLGAAEQEVREAIEEGRPGFNGGWVSSKYLDQLLFDIRATRAVPRNVRRAMMQTLGYDWHPALVEGRVNSVVTPDGGKPKLFVKAGHLALNLTTSAAVADAYSRAQQVAPVQSEAARVFAPGGTP